MENVMSKFYDLTKAENLDAQIFYLNQQVRREIAVFNRVKALNHIPKMLTLLNARKRLYEAENDAEGLNFVTFRTAVTLQDLA